MHNSKRICTEARNTRLDGNKKVVHDIEFRVAA